MGNTRNLTFLEKSIETYRLTLQDQRQNFIIKNNPKQECIPVGCVPPAHWPYLVVSYACPPWNNHAWAPWKTMHPPKKPCTPPSNHTCPPEQPRMPLSNHTYPPEQPCTPRATTHAPPEQPCMPPQSNHAHPSPPREQPCTPPRATMHAPQSNHACNPQMPPGATTHATPRCPWEQPRMPPPPRSNHAHPPLWTDRHL